MKTSLNPPHHHHCGFYSQHHTLGEVCANGFIELYLFCWFVKQNQNHL